MFRLSLVRGALWCLVPLVGASWLDAAELYLTADGAGDRTGVSWEHALGRDALNKAVNELLQPGDRLLLGGGEYADAELAISVGGEAGKPKKIVGVDRGQGLPTLSSQWSVDAPTRGKTAVKLAASASHLTFEKLRIHGYQVAILASPTEGKAREQLRFFDVDVDHMRHAHYLSDCDDVELADCDVKRYSKHGIRFEAGCDRVVLRRCTADCSEGDAEWETKTELFPFGFDVNDGGAPSTQLLFEDCLAANNLMPLQKTKYKNGDGFVMEANNRDVTLIRCRSIRNQDGGFDLKVPGVVLKGCVAIGNGRNIRIWNGGTLDNCFTGWAKTGIWSNGAALTVNRTTFHELDTAVLTDDRASEPVTVSAGLISKVARQHFNTAHGNAVFAETVVVAEGEDPQYVNPDPKWNGLGDAMNSRAHPNQGYRNAK